MHSPGNVFLVHYIYIESSAPRVKVDKADLLTPKMTSANAKCLTFYYHMKGSSIGSLKIFQKVSDSHRGFHFRHASL